MDILESFILLLLALALQFPPSAAMAATGPLSLARPEPALAAPLRLAQRQCSQRMGPYVTQSTAWQRLREAQRRGYGVSGVFPCYGTGGRGYCFNVFFPC